MAVNYSDERLVQVQNDENKAMAEINKTYSDMIGQSDGYYQAQIDASKEWADKQTELQQEKTDFAIEQIEQQKEQANRDYQREQSGAYVDWQKESNRYGANAEEMASGGFANSGYSESVQVSMFNTYQNRVAAARESYNQAVLNYNNAIKDAQLQNSSVLAEIAFQSFQQQLELSLQGFQYHNQLVTEKLNQKKETQQIYHSQYMDVLDQINTENALAEQIRQYNESLAEERRQYNSSLALQQAQLEEEKRQYNESMAFQKQQYADSQKKSSGSVRGSSGGGSKSGSDSSKKSFVAVAKGNTSDADTYGTFSNGYQPKGIGGYGKVSKTGDKVVVNGKTQNLWKTSDGTLWYWDGSVRQYRQTTRPKSSSSKKAGGVALGIAPTFKK